MKSNKSLITYLLMMIGMGLFLLSNGRWIVPVFTWLAFIILIRAFRNFKGRLGIFVFFVLVTYVQAIKFKGMIPAPGALYSIIIIVGSISLMIPFQVDRWLTKRVEGFAATFAFPITWVLMEYIAAASNPYAGSWGALAHTQDNLDLLQITSLTGMWGLTFLIAWVGPSVNWFWDRRQNLRRIKKQIFLFGLVIFSIILFGQVRHHFFSASAKTVRIASIVHDETLADSSKYYKDVNLLPAFRYQTKQIQEKVLGFSESAAENGAKIIFLHEGSLMVLKEDEQALINKASRLARDQKIYFGLSLFVMPLDFPQSKGEAKIIWIDPEGNQAMEFHKAYPTPVDPIHAGEKMIKTMDTPYGRITSVICFDMDFPTFIRQAGKKGVDIMLVPANDWKEITPYHPRMAQLRAIENGFSMVRATGNGLSLAVDHKGRVLNQMNGYQTSENIMYSDVPVKGVTTIYAKVGDWFVWVCFAGLLYLIWRVRVIGDSVDGGAP